MELQEDDRHIYAFPRLPFSSIKFHNIHGFFCML